MNLIYYTIKTYSQRQKDKLLKLLLGAGLELYKGYGGYPSTINGNRIKHSFKRCPYIVFHSNGYIANESENGFKSDGYLDHNNLDAKQDYLRFILIVTEIRDMLNKG